MNKSIKDYIKNLELFLGFDDLAWWIIDYENDPLHFYCNNLMAKNFNLNQSLEKYNIEENIFFDNIQDSNNIFSFFDEKTNSVKYFSSKYKVLKKDDNDNNLIVYGIIEDITMNNSMNEYIDIVDKYVITSTTNMKGIITNISTAYCNITGYTREELIGKKHSVLKHPDIPRRVYRDMWKTITAGKKWEGELKNLRKDGTEFWIKLVISPSFDTNGNIKCFTTINQDITDKKIIENLSIKDTLTNVYNRRKLDDLLTKEISFVQRYNIDFSIILMDVDFFKSINDNFGHLIGDKVLVEISKILVENTRKVDHVGRWGGEEFLIICPNSNSKEAKSVADKLREYIENFDFGIEQCVTASFGVSSFKTDDNIDDILNRADNALYLAKNSGRNQVQLLN